MNARSSVRRRGQPLVALILLMISWVGARAALWEAPKIAPARTMRVQSVAEPARPRPIAPHSAVAPRIAPAQPSLAPPPVTPGTSVQPAAPAGQSEPTAPVIAPPVADIPSDRPGDQPDEAGATQPQRERMSPKTAAGHAELFSIGMNMPTLEQAGAMDTASAQGAPIAAAAASAAASGSGQSPGSRWSLDAWVLLRQGGNGYNAPGAGLPGVVVPAGFYGGSQAGAVLRYRLLPASGLRPALYLRAASGLEYPRGEELAAGFSIRPAPKVPVALMVEARATRTPGGTRVRPAVAVVTELPPARLPLGLRGEAYAQAGYVGGAGKTAFVDGQARIERPLVQAGRFRLRAGGGVWGGAQQGASRLDVGPTATVALPVGSGGARLSADYRIRIAGRAAPGSGAVVTLSAGF